MSFCFPTLRTVLVTCHLAATFFKEAWYLRRASLKILHGPKECTHFSRDHHATDNEYSLKRLTVLTKHRCLSLLKEMQPKSKK